MALPKFLELQDRSWVHEQYVERGLTMREIADLLGCDRMSVSRALRRHGIEGRPSPGPSAVEVGQRYGLLTVTAYNGVSRGHRVFEASCDCGETSLVRAGNLASGNTRSCGCREHGNNVTHGATGTPTFRSWLSMKRRCNDPKAVQFKYYGGRGIIIYPNWYSFENFLADMGERPEGMTLDRINPDGNYEPGNCRWADASTQRVNRSGKQ